MKKMLLIFVLFAFLPLLTSCGMNDAGIIKWSYKDELLDWKDVKNVTYYELEFYQTDQETGEPTIPLQPLNMMDFKAYAFDSQYSFYGLPNDYTYNFKIKLYYKDGSTDESELIQIWHYIEFPHPVQVAIGSYVGYTLSWTDMTSKELNLINYTLKINDEEFDVDTNNYDMNDYDSGIYKIQVKANYESGSSEWTEPYYTSIGLEGSQLQANYNLTSEEDFSYTLDTDEDINVVIGRYNFFYSLHGPLPDSIITIDGSTITLNQYYLKTISDEPSTIIAQIRILTDDNIYTLYIMNETSGE